MSFRGQLSELFLQPLMGRTATFLLEGRQANLEFARAMIRLAASAGVSCAILDLDAFYSSNAHYILASLAGAARSTVIRIPEPGSDIEAEFSRLFETPQKVVIVDSLNSLYHLISSEDGGARGRKMAFALASLSYLARTNGRAVVLSMYRREGFAGSATGRSISSLSDVTASVDVTGEDMAIRTQRGSAWPAGMFSIRIPSK